VSASAASTSGLREATFVASLAYQSAVLELLLLVAGIRVAGVEFAPKDLIFAAAETRSRAVADGPLPDGCKWSFTAETRVAKRDDDKGCVRYFYKTTVVLEQSCPAPNPSSTPCSEQKPPLVAAAAPVTVRPAVPPPPAPVIFPPSAPERMARS